MGPFSVYWAAPKRQVAGIWPGSGPVRSPYVAGEPRPRRSARATSRAWSRQPHGSRAHADGVPDRGASRRRDEPQMLEVLVRELPGELVVRREHRLQRIEHVLPCLCSSAALTEGPGNLQYTRDNPAILIGLVEGDREVDRWRHTTRVASRMPPDRCGAAGIVRVPATGRAAASPVRWSLALALRRAGHHAARALQRLDRIRRRHRPAGLCERAAHALRSRSARHRGVHRVKQPLGIQAPGR
jgi:hypothetical protein